MPQNDLTSSKQDTKTGSECNTEITMTTFDADRKYSLLSKMQSSTDSSSPKRYLKLPEQSMGFIWLLMQKNDLNLYFKSDCSGTGRPLYALYMFFNSFYKKILRSVSNHSPVRPNYDLYCKYLLKRVNDKISGKFERFVCI